MVQVTAANQPPTAVISGPPSGLVGERLSFDGSTSNDDGQIVSYVWDFGDENTGSGITATHVYTQAGSYQVGLVVTDDGGLTAHTIHGIQIAPTPEAAIEEQSHIYGL
jgi:PKD repeat protein